MFFFPRESAVVCSPQLSLIISSCFYRSGLSSCETPPHTPAFYRYQQQRLPCVCAGMNCVQSAWPLSLLFSLKSCSVAEQKATSRSPPLQVGIVVYLYLRVEVAVVSSVLYSSLPVCCHIPVFYIKSIRWI